MMSALFNILSRVGIHINTYFTLIRQMPNNFHESFHLNFILTILQLPILYFWKFVRYSINALLMRSINQYIFELFFKEKGFNS
jgi:hypothetical protein